MPVFSHRSFEREADRTADEALAAPSSFRTTPPAVSRAQSTQPGASARESSAMSGAMRGPGASLEPAFRQRMERRLGFDFSTVRVHAGQEAQESATRLDAEAYTLGRDIVFGPGRFAPGTASGQRLIAHELVHVMQQRGLSPEGAPLQRKQSRDPDEVAATNKEEAALTDLAKRALADKHSDMAVHEVMWRLINTHGLDMHFELSGTRYEKNHKGVSVDMNNKKGPSTTATLIAGDDALRRVANGQAAQVAKEIEAQIAHVGQARGTIDYVFIMGKDKPKTHNPFYKEAKIFFKAEYPAAVMVEDVKDLDGINARINLEGKPVNDLIVVSHAHPDGTLQFPLAPHLGTPGHVQFGDLKEANQKGALTQPKPDLVGFWTNVLIRGCNLGRDADMLSEVQTAFGGHARVIAPTHEQRYSGGQESLAGPYYEEPGDSKTKDADALQKIEANPEYGFVTNWKSMSKSLQRQPDKVTEEVWSGQFPASGNEAALLAANRKQLTGPPSEYTFDSRQANGDKTDFVFKPKHPFKFGPATISIETPPTDAQAIAEAKNRTARPSAYTFAVRHVRNGLLLSINVDVERTEWILYHQPLLKGGQPFNPSPGVAPWYGDTDSRP